MGAIVPHVSPYGGSWYPDDPTELSELLEKLFADSRRRTGGFLYPRPLAFVVPHAGLVYSGTVAAAAYRYLAEIRPARVILLGFAHRGSPPGVWLPDIAAFRTPAGEMEVDTSLAAKLAELPEFGFLQESALCDHSVEIQLPLLLRATPDTRVLPLYVSRLHPSVREAAARALAEHVRAGAVLLASSDFTHYGRAFHYLPFPTDDWTADRLRGLDESLIEAAGSLRADFFFAALRAVSATLCGYEPISLMLETLRLLENGEEVFQETLDYQTSGELAGDFQHSVSYAALGFFPHSSFALERPEQEALLGCARRTLEQFQRTGERRAIPPETPGPALQRRGAAFVTLWKDGKLRGCVGRRDAVEPLALTIPDLTLSAALDDSRFEALSPDETGIDIEISLLTPLKRIPDRSCFRVNHHGAVLQAGLHQALLLPQVATERNWSADRFFDALARKAGASPDCYRDRATRLSVFRAQVF